ncbi:hypothetical protein CASFOL_022482 [Castilleja foliolosa]|uniref:Uncharacterized protein n=1 Tax=Castilleja foliolosa TaxID=1961234 RepID=A0ABD3CUN3_9LAMI
MDGYLDNQLMFLGWLSHGMAMPVADADGPFIISEITNKLIFWWTIVSSSFQDFAYCITREIIFSNPAQKFFLLCRFIDRYVHIVGEGEGMKKGMAMTVAYADGPFIISEITNKLVFGWTIESSSFQDFAYCCTHELIFSNPDQKLFLLCRFIDRYMQIVGEGEGVKKVYMDGYLDNQLMLLGWLSHGMAMPVADVDSPFIISEIINKLVFGWTIVSSSFQDFAYCVTRELIFSNPAQKQFLLFRFIDRYVQIVGERDGVKKVYMDGYLDNQLMLLGWHSHGMAMLVADANGPFIISEITNRLVFRWTIVSSSFQDFAYCGTCKLIFSNPTQSHGMEIPVADVDGPLLYLKLQTNSIFGGLLCHRLLKNSLIVALVNSYSPTRHGMAMLVAYADAPFIISVITNKLVFGWTIMSSSFQDFAYCGTRELIFSIPAQKFFLLCRFIDRYVHIVGEGEGVKKVYMDGYLDNQLMLLGWHSHGMAMSVADANGPFIISEITNKLVFRWTIVSSSFQDFAYCGTFDVVWMAQPRNGNTGGRCRWPFIISEITNKLDFWWPIVPSSSQEFAYCGTRELIFSNPAQKLFLLCRFIERYVQIVGEGDGVKKIYMDGYLDNQLMLLG